MKSRRLCLQGLPNKPPPTTQNASRKFSGTKIRRSGEQYLVDVLCPQNVLKLTYNRLLIPKFSRSDTPDSFKKGEKGRRGGRKRGGGCVMAVRGWGVCAPCLSAFYAVWSDVI